MRRNSVRFLFFIAVLLSALLLGGCGSADEELPELPTGFTRFLDEELGLTFAYPEGWALADLPRVMTVASTEALLATPEISATNPGSLASVAVGNTAQLGSDNPIEILNLLLDSSGARGQVEILEEPNSISINGHQAATATFGSNSNGIPLTLRLTIIRHGDRIVTVSTATPTSMIAETGPLLDDIINSVKILADEALSGSQ